MPVKKHRVEPTIDKLRVNETLTGQGMFPVAAKRSGPPICLLLESATLRIR